MKKTRGFLGSSIAIACALVFLGAICASLVSQACQTCGDDIWSGGQVSTLTGTGGKFECAHGPEYDSDCPEEEPYGCCETDDTPGCLPSDCECYKCGQDAGCEPMIVRMTAWCGYRDNEYVEDCDCSYHWVTPYGGSAAVSWAVSTRLKSGVTQCGYSPSAPVPQGNILCGGGWYPANPLCGMGGSGSAPDDPSDNQADAFGCIDLLSSCEMYGQYHTIVTSTLVKECLYE